MHEVAPQEQLRVFVQATDAAMRDAVTTKLRRAGLALAATPDRLPEAVVVMAAGEVGEAIKWCPSTCRSGEHRLLVVANTVSPVEVLKAVRMGVRAVLPFAEATSARLAATVRSVFDGDCRMSHTLLVQMLSGATVAPTTTTNRDAPPSLLTTRQAAVLSLVSDGYRNAAIAEALSCSEHTVKNVMYEVMARLQARNRAHAVARAIRLGLI